MQEAHFGVATKNVIVNRGDVDTSLAERNFNEELKKAVSDYATKGFKVYYNEHGRSN